MTNLKAKKNTKNMEKQNSPQTIKECKNTEEEDLKRFGGSKSNFSDEEFADSFNLMRKREKTSSKILLIWLIFTKANFPCTRNANEPLRKRHNELSKTNKNGPYSHCG